jgi:hypothetical protein
VNDAGGGAALGLGVLVFLVLLYVGFAAFFLYVYVRIVRKAGYSGWWVLLGIVPIANLVVLVMFAFAEWPIERQLRMARTGQALPGAGYGGGQPGYLPQAAPSRFGSAAPAAGTAAIAPGTSIGGAGWGSSAGGGLEPLPAKPVFGSNADGGRGPAQGF